MAHFIKTKFIGVYKKESTHRKHDGRADVVYYYTLKVDGSKKWIKVGWASDGFTATFASHERAKAMQALQEGMPVAHSMLTNSECITLEEAFHIFDEKHLTINIKNPKDERKRFNNYIRPLLGMKRLDKINVLDLENIKIQYRHLSAATIRHILSDIRRIYRKMILFDIYKGPDPTRKIIMPKVDNARERFLTKDEASTLLSFLKIKSLKWHDITKMSLATGMRLSEILNLRLQDINFDCGVISIRGKTGSRQIPMSITCREILQERVLSMKIRKSSQFIFAKKSGEKLKDGYSSSSFRQCVQSLGLNPQGIDRKNRVCFHTMRHTYCSWLAISGVPLYTIGELVGHNSQEMTKRYSHLCPMGAKSAVAKVDIFFS